MSSETSPPEDRTDLLELTRTLAAAGSGAALAPGTRFGRYILLSALGEGGMGAVYLAEQTEPVRRKVAIKLSRQRRVSAEELARFAVERQALARMSHPAIAQIFDAGTVDDGTPYFVMEYVEGERLTEYCRVRGLELPSRIELMRRVCLGVAHAHQKGVIHCDLKPGNILATEVDGHGQPKIIDFGIARALGAGSRDGSSGTPGYMSPEQARGATDIDTRTDVYSLGLLLWELVSGRPFRDRNRLGELSMDALRDALTNEVPLPLPATPGLSAGRRRELDAILAKALAPGVEARYAGAAQLAEDLDRWQSKLPVDALPETTGYRLRCLLRRHALAATVGMVALLALVGGLIGTGYGLLEANTQRAEAEARQAELEKVVAFQQRVLTEIDVSAMAHSLVTELKAGTGRAGRATGKSTVQIEAELAKLDTLLKDAAPADAARVMLRDQVLGRAAELVDSDYANGDAVEASLRLALAEVFMTQSLLADADRQLAPALALRRALFGDSHPTTLEARMAEVNLHWWKGELSEGASKAAALSRDCESSMDRLAYLCRRSLRAKGLLLHRTGDSPQALPILADFLDRQRAADGPWHPQTVQAAGVYFDVRAHAEQVCSSSFKRELDQFLVALPAEDGMRAARSTAASTRGICHILDAEFPAAVEQFAETYALNKELYGFTHQLTRGAGTSLAGVLVRSGRYDEARALIEALHESILLTDGPQHPNLLQVQSALALLETAEARYAEAIAAANRLVEGSLALHGSDHPYSMYALLTRAETRQRAGDDEGALEDLRVLEAVFERATAPSRLERLWGRTVALEARLAMEGEVDEEAAGKLIAELLDTLVPTHLLVSRAALALALHFDRSGRPKEAARLRSEHLEWLLSADEALLGEEQRAMRRRLQTHVVNAALSGRPGAGPPTQMPRILDGRQLSQATGCYLIHGDADPPPPKRT